MIVCADAYTQNTPCHRYPQPIHRKARVKFKTGDLIRATHDSGLHSHFIGLIAEIDKDKDVLSIYWIAPRYTITYNFKAGRGFEHVVQND